MRTPRALPVYPWGDNEHLEFGDGADYAIYFNGTDFHIDGDLTTSVFILENTGAAELKIRTACASLSILPVDTGVAYPYIKFIKTGDFRLYLEIAKSFFIYEAGVKILDIAYAGDIPTITASVVNDDIQLIPNGTGRVRFGTKTGSGDVLIDGYVSIKDAAGNAVKLATVA